MDPIGFAMENFDGIGRWRAREDGQPIDASGTLFTGATLDGVNGLRQELSRRPEVFVGVLTERMLTYAIGRGLEHYDMPAVRRIVQDARASNYRFSSIVLGVARSVPFPYRRTSAARRRISSTVTSPSGSCTTTLTWPAWRWGRTLVRFQAAKPERAAAADTGAAGAGTR